MTIKRTLLSLPACLILMPSSMALAGDLGTAIANPNPGINPLVLQSLYRRRQDRRPSYAEHLTAQLEAQSGQTTSPLAEQYRHNYEVERALQGIERGLNRPARGINEFGNTRAIPCIPGIGE